MTRGSKVWLVALVLFFLVNLAGAVTAVADWELLHAGIHAALLFPGAYLALRLARRRVAAPGAGAYGPALLNAQQPVGTPEAPRTPVSSDTSV